MADIRRDALIRLNGEWRDLKTAQDIAYTASLILGQTLGVGRVGYGTVDQRAKR